MSESKEQEGLITGVFKILLIAVVVYFAFRFIGGPRKGGGQEGQQYNPERWPAEAYQEPPGGPEGEGWPAWAYEEPPGKGILEGYDPGEHAGLGPAERARLVKERIRLEAEVEKLRQEKFALEQHRQKYPPRERQR